MKKMWLILLLVLFLFQRVYASDPEDILASPNYLTKLTVKLKYHAREMKCHGVQTFYVSKLDVFKDSCGNIDREVVIYWIDGDMLYYYFGEDHISDSKSNNLRKDVYKTRKEIYGSSFLMTVDEARGIIQRCKNGNKVIIKMPCKKT